MLIEKVEEEEAPQRHGEMQGFLVLSSSCLVEETRRLWSENPSVVFKPTTKN